MLRVITGTAKGCKLKKPPKARPISNRAKSSLFSVLGSDILNKKILDLYAGSGSLGIESLSRGAESCCFVDISRSAISDITANLNTTELINKAHVKQDKVLLFIEGQPNNSFDIVFADPPFDFYNKGTEKLGNLILDIIPIINNGGAIILKYPSQIELPDIKGLTLADKRTFGSSGIAIWVKIPVNKTRLP